MNSLAAERLKAEANLGALDARRRELGVSRERLAAAAGISTATLNNIATGANVPQLHTIIALACALDLRAEDVLGDREVDQLRAFLGSER